jgi:hypothetical protein
MAAVVSRADQGESMRIAIRRLDLPAFGGPEEIPAIPARLYARRLRRLRARMRAERLDALALYADREHSANLAWLTGFDPRFEEALFILTRDDQRTLIVGNECAGIVSRLPIRTAVALCQEFSLMGQDRSVSWDLKPVLKRSGLRRGTRCGLIGWKTLRAGRIEVPAYIAQLLADICGATPVNANDLLMHPARGLRIFNEPEQIAFFEYAAVKTSESVLNLLRALRPGSRGFEAARAYDAGGLPLSCHPMLAFGRDIPNGMASPGNERLVRGDRLTCAFGVWGSLTCRAGLAIRDARGWRTAVGRRHWQVIENYLQVTRAWYAGIRAGACAGDVWQAVEAARAKTLYTFCVNPGHYIHLDEWVSSPFERGATACLPSSCALQADIIPVGRRQAVSVNMEDGIVVADAALRNELLRRYPRLYARCAARRAFMQDALGYELSDDVLPLGNIPGVYFPYLLDTRRVCVFDA